MLKELLNEYKYWTCFLILLLCIFLVLKFWSPFKNNSSEIQALKNNWDSNSEYFKKAKQIISADFSTNENIYFNFENNNVTFEYYKIEKGDTLISLQDENKEINDKKLSQDLEFINWNKEKVISLKKTLEKANVNSISNGNPSRFFWNESSLNGYIYLIFNDNLNDSLIHLYNDSCSYLYYKDNIVLSFSGGPGWNNSSCFPELRTQTHH